MQPLSVANIDDLDQMMYLAGSGTVASIESDPPSFIVHATQYVAGGQSSDDITVRGDMGDNPKWTNPQECLLPVKAVVVFWGLLQHFDSYHPPNTKESLTCVIVAVHNITYLYNPPRDKSVTTSTSESAHKKSKLREQLRARAEEKQGSQTTSSPSTSQTKLGKRKAPSSEDEVDEDV
jgi:hypothetical protein